ncbi:hypothetical protein J132_00584 [Termitomyces sp. J132]|nr:hypothetical protein H2248_007213 [Termitomyces sp. 'cryptogamus']KNZ73195.1 hypothetical protein J132_00584 [Termitomyces sp. J132]
MPANQHHAEYAPPVLRAPSPASSIGTVYDEDQTASSDREEQISQSSFEAKWEERLALHIPRPEELLADQDPLLPRPPIGSAEEKQLFEDVLARLHQTVHDLEDNELFDRTLLRGSQAALEPLPSTNDIDALMRSMMVTPQPSVNVPQPNPTRGRSGSRTDGILHGPWAVNGHEAQAETNGSLLSTGIVPGKRSRNGSRRN